MLGLSCSSWCYCSVVPVGEASVIVAASAVHRQPAIEAVTHAIDAIKETATIWKKVTNPFHVLYLFDETLWLCYKDRTIPFGIKLIVHILYGD